MTGDRPLKLHSGAISARPRNARLLTGSDRVAGRPVLLATARQDEPG